ncbi:Oidioi.mRNA.OKI2018_I69.chr1.g3902.t2.cds [Oikopleura dioica]|uniref:Oidioi.mRNA.OKI2018_I69.chr1.g3902.t2.cds n=1 Tax=Oikopleura dioica TaxID=34765 RepID=A0ABN7SW54_OIKDI|nr:Oidioi.mRNA.OKI2018_I69.chr1.g3902.t2.cds [Oikopleura dioica]
METFLHVNGKGEFDRQLRKAESELRPPPPKSPPSHRRSVQNTPPPPKEPSRQSSATSSPEPSPYDHLFQQLQVFELGVHTEMNLKATKQILKLARNREIPPKLILKFAKVLCSHVHYECKRSGGELLFLLAENIGELIPDFVDVVVGVLEEKNRELKILHYTALTAASRSAGTTDLVDILIRKMKVPGTTSKQKAEVGNALTMLLLTYPLDSIAVQVCQGIMPLLLSNSPKVRHAGVELCAAIASVLHESELEPLRKVLTSYDIRNHGQSISGEIYARIARKNPPEVDSFGLLVYGERPRNVRESTDLNLTGPRKGSAGRARSHFPQDFYQDPNTRPKNGWMTSEEERKEKENNNYQKFQALSAASSSSSMQNDSSLSSSMPASFFKNNLPHKRPSSNEVDSNTLKPTRKPSMPRSAKPSRSNEQYREYNSNTINLSSSYAAKPTMLDPRESENSPRKLTPLSQKGVNVVTKNSMLSPEIEAQLGPMADPNNFSAHDLFSSLTYDGNSPGSVSPERPFSRPKPSSVPPTHTKSDYSGGDSSPDYTSRGKENTNSHHSRSPMSPSTQSSSLPRTPENQENGAAFMDARISHIRRSARDRRKRNRIEEQEKLSRTNTQESSLAGFAPSNNLPRTPPSGAQRSPIPNGDSSPLEAVGRALSNTSLDNSSVTRSLFSENKDPGSNRYKPAKKTSKAKLNSSFGGSIAGVGYADKFQKELDNRPIKPGETVSESSLHQRPYGLPMPYSDENPSDLSLDSRNTLPRPPRITGKKSEPVLQHRNAIPHHRPDFNSSTDFNGSGSFGKSPRINSSGSGTGSTGGEVTPLSRPGKEFDKALAYMSDPGIEWNKHVEALSIIRSLVHFNQEILLPKVSETTQLVIKNVGNLRSKVSGLATETMRDLFRVLKKAVAPQLESAMKTLLTEAGKENAFLREKIERCLEEGVQAMVVDGLGGKMLAALAQHQKSKNTAVRTLVARYTYETIQKMSPGRALSETRDTTERVYPMMMSAVIDQSDQVRYWGKRMVALLQVHEDFERLAGKYLNNNNTAKLLEESHKVRTKGIGEKPQSARRTLSGRSNTRLPPDRQNSSPLRITSRSGPARVDDTLKDDLKAAISGTTHETKVRALNTVRNIIRAGGSLGNELKHVTDLVCKMLKSAAPNSYQEALNIAPDLIHYVSEDHVSYRNLFLAVAERVTAGAGGHNKAASKLLDDMCNNADPAALVQPLAQRIKNAATGRPKLTSKFTEILEKLGSSKMSTVQKWGPFALWEVIRDHRCRQQAKLLAEVLYDAIGDPLFDLARKEKLESDLRGMLDYR